MRRVPRAVVRGFRLVGFAVWFGRELVRANLQVAWDVLTPRSRLEPGVVELPLRSRTDLEIAGIANLISLTPGTLTLAVRADPPALWVHGMYAADPDSFQHRLHLMEDRMLRALHAPNPDQQEP